MGKSKKRKLEKLEPDNETNKIRRFEKQTTPSELVNVAEESNDPHTAEVFPDGDSGMLINKWLNELDDQESTLVEELGNVSETEEDTTNYLQEILSNIEVKMRDKLKGLTNDDKSKAFRYECEWKGCVFMSGKDRKYFHHVETHAQAAEEQGGSYVCEWDLCDFRVGTHSEFVAHVHFHAYHTKIKVHGASLSLLMKFPHCLLDSQTRNNISNEPTCYTCEWDDCDEKFHRALEFYHHVHSHILDLFPIGKKTLKQSTVCRWSNCKQPIKVYPWGLVHSQKHTGRRVIGCFNCGQTHFNNTRYRDHCYAQLDVAYRRYKCEICYKHFTSKKLLSSHKSVHDLRVSCTMCPRKCISKTALALHIRQAHIKERSMVCGQCEYRTYTKQLLESHIANKHGTRKLFRCDEFGCNATFKVDAALKRHISKHYNIPPMRYACHICENQYTTGWRMSKHLRNVHQLKPTPGYLTFRYKQDVEGTCRLNTHVDKQRTKCKAETQPPEAKSSEYDTTNGENASTELPNNAAHVTVKTKINNITVVGKSKIAIDLGVDFGEKNEEISLQQTPVLKSVDIKKEPNDDPKTNEEPRQQAKKQVKMMGKSKKVQEYTVMQRYLRSNN